MGAGKEFEGKDLDEALRAASKALGAGPGQIEYELLAEGRRGVFGIGARNVRIWVNLPVGDTPGIQALERSFERARTAPAATPEALLERLIEAMGLDLTLRTETADGGTSIELAGPDASYLTANDGELLEALRFLLQRMVREPAAARIQLECEGYRSERDQGVIDRARAAAREVARTGIARRLPALNAYERRLVHITVREFPELASVSEGNGPLKKVKIFLAEPRGEA